MREILKKIQRKKVLVVGDLMVDTYTIGNVKRISPEAPVVVLNVTSETRKPGGAGNVMCNLVALGMEVVALGRIGEDRAGDDLIQALSDEKISVHGLVREKTFQTPVKNRMIAGNQQIVRIDYERPSSLSAEAENQIVHNLPHLLQDVHVVTISDYAKGFCTPRLLESVIDAATARDIPVVSDPKGSSFGRYRNSTIIKPNLQEAYRAANCEEGISLDEVAKIIMKNVACQTLMITRSKEGISLFSGTQARQDFPAFVHQVNDVTGAGDTVSAVMSVALANKISLDQGAYLANVAASIVVERVGCACVVIDEIAQRIREIEAKKQSS